MPANGLRVNHYDFVALHSMWIIFLKGYCVLVRVEIIHKSKFLPGTVEKNSSTIRSSGRNRTHACSNPRTVRRHYHPKYTLITLALVSYLRSLVVRAVHRHRTGVGSIPAGGPYS